MKILTIGDIHCKASALHDMDVLMKELDLIIDDEQPDYIVVTGDMHDSFATINLFAFNKIIKMMKFLSSKAPLYYIVGNHDQSSATAFHTDNHAFTVFKDWKNVTIIDRFEEKVLWKDSLNVETVMCSYMPPGEFIKLYDSKQLYNPRLVFTHQEYRGSDLGSIVSQTGDIWPESYAFVINGHIHDRSYQQPNLLHVGTPRFTTFAEITQRSVSILELTETNIQERPVLLNMPRKHTLILKTQDINQNLPILLNSTSQDEIRLIIQDQDTAIQAYKKTQEYLSLLNRPGLKVVTKPVTSAVIKNSKRLTFSETLVQYLTERSPKVLPVLEEVKRAYQG